MHHMKLFYLHYEDILILVTFQFFKDVASNLHPFLNMHQTDQPMMIFLCEDLEDMYRRLLKMVVHKAIIDKTRTPVHLIKIDLDDKLNILSPSELKLPTATIHLLQGIEQGKKLRFKTYCGLLLSEASKACYEMIKYGCKKGCTGNCKCKRYDLDCTELCWCGGDCVPIADA